MKIPVINSSISFALHLVLVFVLLQYTNLSVYALLIGDVTFPLVIALLNCNNLRKSVGYTFEYEGTFIKPFIISAIMGALCVSIYKLLEHIEVNTTTSFLISLLIAISFYLIAVIKSKVFTNEELLDLPMGNKIVKIARRINKK